MNTKPKCNFCFGPMEVYNICKLLDEHAASHANQVRTAESTAKFVKERTGNAAQIDEIELEALAEMYDHPIEHMRSTWQPSGATQLPPSPSPSMNIQSRHY